MIKIPKMEISNNSVINWEIKNGTVTLKYILAFSYSAMHNFKPVDPKINQSWIFIGRTDAEAEAPVFSPHDAKSQLIGKDWC